MSPQVWHAANDIVGELAEIGHHGQVKEGCQGTFSAAPQRGGKPPKAWTHPDGPEKINPRADAGLRPSLGD
jgi:hypothetical protein